jgi:hypothetical protein
MDKFSSFSGGKMNLGKVIASNVCQKEDGGIIIRFFTAAAVKGDCGCYRLAEGHSLLSKLHLFEAQCTISTHFGSFLLINYKAGLLLAYSEYTWRITCGHSCQQKG